MKISTSAKQTSSPDDKRKVYYLSAISVKKVVANLKEYFSHTSKKKHFLILH